VSVDNPCLRQQQSLLSYHYIATATATAATATAATAMQVKLYGFCSKQDKICMVMELARGALSNLLYDSHFQYAEVQEPRLFLVEKMRAAMLLDIARGMAQL
jgi:hypothetical protein